jgi:hypothetical protein
MTTGPTERGVTRLVPVLAPVGLAVLLTAAYVATLMPGPGFHWDSARFSFVGRVLGIPHPTGYPGYLMLNHLFTKFFPIGSLAYKANLLSGLFSVGAGCLVYAILLLLGVRRSVAFAVGLIFGLSRTLWSQSVVAEVYSLHVLFLAATTFFLLRWSRRRRPYDLVLGCAAYALSFGNHMTTITALPAIVFLVLAVDRSVLRNLRLVLAVAAVVLVGAAQYLYLFWVTADPSRPYIEIPVQSWADFVHITTGAEYKADMFDFTAAQLFFERVPFFVRELVEQFNILLGVALIGLLTHRPRRENLFLFLLFLGNTVFAVNYRIWDIHYYFIPSYLIVALYVGLGLEFLWRRLGEHAGPITRSVALSAAVITTFCLNFGVVDMSAERSLAQTIEGMIRTAKSDTLILVDDHGMARFFHYYLIGEGRGASGVHATYRPEGIREYLEGSATIHLPDERMNLPPGRRVLVAGLGYARELSEQGFTIVGIRRDLPIFGVQLEAVAAQPAAAQRPER